MSSASSSGKPGLIPISCWNLRPCRCLKCTWLQCLDHRLLQIRVYSLVALQSPNPLATSCPPWVNYQKKTKKKRAFKMTYRKPEPVGSKAIRGAGPGPLVCLRHLRQPTSPPAPESPSPHHPYPCFGCAPSPLGFSTHTQLEGSLEHGTQVIPLCRSNT